MAFLLGRSSGTSAPIQATTVPTAQAQESTSTPVPTIAPKGSTPMPTVPPVQATEIPTPPSTPTPTVARSNRAYGDCLARTFLELEVLARGRFQTREGDGYSDYAIREAIERRAVDYTDAICQIYAPEEPQKSTRTSLTCIPNAIESFYRSHIPSGSSIFREVLPLAGQYALTVCKPTIEVPK